MIRLDDGTEIEAHEEEDEDFDPADAGHDEDDDDEMDGAGDAESPEKVDVAGGATKADADGGIASADGANGTSPSGTPAAEPSYGSGDQQQSPGLDASSLATDLTGLVKQMLGVIAADPSKKAALVELATDAQASLKRGDLQQASAGIDIFREALGAAKDSGAQPSASPETATNGAGPNGAAANGAAAAPAIAKARTAWVATRQKVEGDLGKLHDAFGSAFQGHDQEEAISKAFRERVETVLGALDDELAHTLDAINNAKDPGEREQLLQQARSHLQRYQQHVASDPTITAIDTNPFVPIALQKTVNGTIDALLRAIH